MAEQNLPATPDGLSPPVTLAGENVSWQNRAREMLAQPAIKRAMPALVGIGAIAALAGLYLAIASGPQRILYSGLTDSERASVVEALETSGISYDIDNGTGVITVTEDDVYRARMLVASNAGLAAPAGASEMLDSIPLGSSRTLEGERLRLARERELMLTIREIDGIESVRVHLATPERSVFVREKAAPSASVMVRLVSGRSLSQSQVEAIVNLVSGSVPGMTSDAVRVVDQNGQLLSSPRDSEMDSLLLQREFEGKLQDQISSLLLPLLGEGNFSSQVQVELDKSEVTSARESYDSDGAVRSESERNSSRVAGSGAGGVPGVTANTPPPDAELVDEIPATANAAEQGGAGQAVPRDSESAFSRNYELGREVAVTNVRSGGLVKLSVAVAVSNAALEAAAPMTAEQLQTLVGAAVGADVNRGDQVEIVVSAFEATELEPPAFYEEVWFATVLRYATALLCVLLVLFLVVRPLMKRIRAEPAQKDEAETEALPAPENGALDADSPADFGDLPQQIDLARRLAVSQPERAVEALQRMLEAPATNPSEAS